MQRLQVRLPGSNGNRVLISRITTPNTLHAEYTKKIGGREKLKDPPPRKKTINRQKKGKKKNKTKEKQGPRGSQEKRRKEKKVKKELISEN